MEHWLATNTHLEKTIKSRTITFYWNPQKLLKVRDQMPFKEVVVPIPSHSYQPVLLSQFLNSKNQKASPQQWWGCGREIGTLQHHVFPARYFSPLFLGLPLLPNAENTSSSPLIIQAGVCQYAPFCVWEKISGLNSMSLCSSFGRSDHSEFFCLFIFQFWLSFSMILPGEES